VKFILFTLAAFTIAIYLGVCAGHYANRKINQHDANVRSHIESIE
jgi:hypothetical protein